MTSPIPSYSSSFSSSSLIGSAAATIAPTAWSTACCCCTLSFTSLNQLQSEDDIVLMQLFSWSMRAGDALPRDMLPHIPMPTLSTAFWTPLVQYTIH